MRVRFAAVLVVILVTGRLVASQPAQMSPELRNAQTLAQAQKWAEAVAAYEVVLKTDKTDPRPHAGIAASLYGLADYRRALTHALEAARLLQDPKTQFAYPGLPVGAVMVRIARIHNRLGNTEEAFTWLTKAAHYPIPNVPMLDAEPDVANLRNDARWKTFRDTVNANVDPCNALPEYRQLDFWVGDWDVVNAAGQRVGSSRVERILNSCAIMETYTAAPGASAAPNYVGQAFHFYDQRLKQWAQHYIDTTGVPFDWQGELRDGAFRYTREGPYGPSNMFVHQRMTFTPKDSGVHQLFEQSIDGGKTWRSGFNAMYVKKAGGGSR